MTSPRRGGILRPLAERDFTLLWLSTTVSLLGDGVYMVTLAWQVYDLSNTPAALAVVGLAMTAAMLVVLPVSGLISDRLSRRRILVGANVLRGGAVLAIGLLSLSDALTLTLLGVLAAGYGLGQALFGPAFGAIVPDLVSREVLLEANALAQVVRPVAMRFAGPALGGAVISGLGPAGLLSAFLLAAACFAVAAALVSLLRPLAGSSRRGRLDLAGIGEGLRFARSQTWIWATLGSWLISLLFFLGPFEVLVPYLVKNQLGGGAADVGLVFAAAGLGAVGAAVLLSRRGLPRRPVLFMYSSFAVGMGVLGLVGLVDAVWQAIPVMLVEGFATTAATLTWTTMLQRLVPPDLLGRVQSLDWLVTQGLVAVSFAVTGPAAAALGPRACLILAGILSAAGQVAFMIVPRLFDVERRLAAGPDEERTGR